MVPCIEQSLFPYYDILYFDSLETIYTRHRAPCSRKRTTWHLYFGAVKRKIFYLPSSNRERILSDLLDKPRSQVSSLLPPRTRLYLVLLMGFSIFAIRRFASKFANSCYIYICIHINTATKKHTTHQVLYAAHVSFICTTSVFYRKTQNQTNRHTRCCFLPVTHVTFIWWGKRSSFRPGTRGLQVRCCALQAPDKASKDDAGKYCATEIRRQRKREEEEGVFQGKALVAMVMNVSSETPRYIPGIIFHHTYTGRLRMVPVE